MTACRSGRIFSGSDLGVVKIARTVKGGDGNESVRFTPEGKLAGVTIGGSLLGGSGDHDTLVVNNRV